MIVTARPFVPQGDKRGSAFVNIVICVYVLV